MPCANAKLASSRSPRFSVEATWEETRSPTYSKGLAVGLRVQSVTADLEARLGV